MKEEKGKKRGKGKGKEKGREREREGKGTKMIEDVSWPKDLSLRQQLAGQHVLLPGWGTERSQVITLDIFK